MDSAEIDAICDPAIGTAGSILQAPPQMADEVHGFDHHRSDESCQAH
jgi:hypothetical protein